jgi:hypothetical protein
LIEENIGAEGNAAVDPHRDFNMTVRLQNETAMCDQLFHGDSLQNDRALSFSVLCYLLSA